MSRCPVWLALVALGACGPKSRPAAPAAEARPELDVPEPWFDPEDDLPRGIRRSAADRAAALTNPKAAAVVIRGAKVLTATGAVHEDATVVLDGGTITFIGTGAHDTPQGAVVIDGKGKVVTPGLIDAHSHI